MVYIDEIQIRIETGNQIDSGIDSEDQKVFLGIGGREFRLRKNQKKTDEFERNQSTEFIIGTPERTNLKEYHDNLKKNELPEEGSISKNSPMLVYSYLEKYPIYIRLETNNDEWNIQKGELIIKEYNGGEKPIPIPADANRWLNKANPFLFLHKQAYVGQIKVKILTGDKDKAEPSDDTEIYLGIGCREFELRTNDNGHPEIKRNEETEYVIGEEANIKNSEDKYDLPIPLTGKVGWIKYDSIEKSPVYIRIEDLKGWNIEQVRVDVFEYETRKSPTGSFKVFKALGLLGGTEKEFGNIWLSDQIGKYLFLS